MAATLVNIWHLRTVGENDSKSCIICFKPSTAVLITPDNKDFFYVCRGHLKDRGFCSPIADDPDVVKKKKEEAQAGIIAKLKLDLESLGGDSDKKKDDDKEKEKDKKNDKDTEKKDEKSKGKEKELDKTKKRKELLDKYDKDLKDADAAVDAKYADPRVFSLHRNFFQMRIDRIRNAEMARRNRERLQNPTAFPSVPTGDP